MGVIDTLPIELIINAVVGFFLFCYWLVAFTILYHLTRFGIGVQPKKFSAIFLLGSITLTCLVIIFASQVDINSLQFKW